MQYICGICTAHLPCTVLMMVICSILYFTSVWWFLRQTTGHCSVWSVRELYDQTGRWRVVWQSLRNFASGDRALSSLAIIAQLDCNHRILLRCQVCPGMHRIFVSRVCVTDMWIKGDNYDQYGTGCIVQYTPHNISRPPVSLSGHSISAEQRR